MKKDTVRAGLYTFLTAVGACVPAANAALVNVTLDATVSNTVAPPETTSIVLGQVETTVDGVSTLTGSSLLESGSIVWTVSVDPDPLLQATVTVENLTADIQTWDLMFGLPVMPLASPILKSGSLSAEFSDDDNSGEATLAILNWDGLIDGVVALELFSGSFSCSGGPGCTGSMAPVSAGPTSDPTAVNNDIGINVALSLTPGDSATIDTFFEVVPVPLPAAAWLFASGLIGLVGFAMRHTTQFA